MTASRTARERVRAELTREITDIARRQLATEGAGGLSLRAVAREMGMVSSAIYRYFPSRDDLLTALIVDGYNALGEAVEQAGSACPRDDFPGRWLAACHAVREWAVAHPHEYALIYGSPVPGYQAPQDTIAARVRDVAVYGRIISDAWEAGAITPPADHAPEELERDAGSFRELMPGVPDAVIWRAVSAWTALYGWVGFEVFGQFNNVIENRRTAFEHAMRLAADTMGIAQ
ncbi:TetR/AcrR family transcriptional regulator [Nonomuraea sp. KC401]|uniref:TetR/AcrR family transcriptional regulator n=1 Tax=unclassified Nonomuraea TaxID=2593643 RepID=UPI0010FE2B1B|nr:MULTISPECIES: TetR/AcrR family transcriptional regulator [unclassified Nonomuraea]NBE92889.1 TetR family transcriptional regulator [Nonomuraea sp. K271]TLF83373.1 TetR/AcrR family transcriptional regulator [Nonomuraea sp. KC401]